MKIEHFLTPYTKINSKWIKDLNVKTWHYKTLRGKQSRTFNDISQSKILYDPPLRIMEIKTKVNKWDLIKLKSFYTAKETINKVKRQPSEWEKIIANETTDKGLVSKIHKQLIQINTRKINNPIKKWEEDLNRDFSKKTHRWLTNTWKDAQHRSLLEKCKSKLQWYITSHCLEWLSSEKPTNNKY